MEALPEAEGSQDRKLLGVQKLRGTGSGDFSQAKACFEMTHVVAVQQRLSWDRI